MKITGREGSVRCREETDLQCVSVCVCVYARTHSSQELSAALWVTETNFSFDPELNYRSNHLE